MSRDFYKSLEAFQDFETASNSAGHKDLPEDWFVVISDVAGSTQAIEKGEYKNVNTVGALAIIGLVNIDRNIEIPYIFGGDGATIAIPKEMVEGAKSALLAVKELAFKEFNIEIRVGLVPVPDLTKMGYICRLAKYKGSEKMEHAVFSGRGWEKAEKLVKDASLVEKYQISEKGDVKAQGDFSGLQCRWDNIPSIRDHKICILIQALKEDAAEQLEIYKNVSREIFAIYGGVEEHHPLRRENLRLSFNPIQLFREAKINGGPGFYSRLKYTLTSLLRNVAGVIIFKFKIDTDSVKWSEYVSDMIQNSDYRKFDGALRMVLDGTNSQKVQLEEYLLALHRDRKICFGLHTSREALMTCLIFSYNGDHTHFVDGADGGYAMAAKQLKKQLASL